MKIESTERVSLSAVQSRSRGWRVFGFRGLPRVSGAHARDSDRLHSLLELGFQSPAGVGKPLALRLGEILETGVKLGFQRASVIPLAEAQAKVSAGAYLGLLSTSPHHQKGLLEVELETAHSAVDVLLGGAAERAEQRPLTEIEEGVLGYLVLEGLRGVGDGAASFLPKLHLEGVAHSAGEVMRGWESPSALCLELRIRLGERPGGIRFYFPSSLLEQLELSPEAKAVAAPKRQLLRSRLSRLRGVGVQLRAEIATVEISRAVLRSVRPGDVVLVDSCLARPDKGQGGKVKLRVGTGMRAHALAELKLDKGQYFARIERFTLGEEPRMDGSADSGPSGGEESSENLNLDEVPNGEGGDLLNDVPLQLAVELARLPLTAEEVANLRAGQVVDLRRGPQQPVELSVHGRIVARGELVEVDGNLGVRILSLND